MSGPFVVCLGEAMVELSLTANAGANARVGFAGDTLNTAIYLKRLLPDARVAYATKVGQDSFSARMTEMMESEGLDTSLVLQSTEKTCGLYAISTDAAGERSFDYWRSASAARDLLAQPALSLKHLLDADMVYLSAISLAILPAEHRLQLLGWLSEYRSAGGRVAFDSNYRPALWENQNVAQDIIAAAWQITDVGMPSIDDEMAVFGDTSESDLLARFAGYGVKNGALKRGSEGPRDLNGAPAATYPPVPKVVDSTAAGDSFNAAYLASHLTDQPQADCLQAGHALASQVIGTRGAILPRQETV